MVLVLKVGYTLVSFAFICPRLTRELKIGHTVAMTTVYVTRFRVIMKKKMCFSDKELLLMPFWYNFTLFSFY